MMGFSTKGKKRNDTSDNSNNSNSRKQSFFKDFRRYVDMQIWLHNLVDKHPEKARLEIIGKSLQNRNIYMIVLKRYSHMSKIAVMIEGGIHAREWISPATVLYFINYVILHKEILEYVDLYVIPCLNPDGYEYTHTCVRLWRKNMNQNGYKSTQYWGVDINRNFPYAYGFAGSSSSPASPNYRGRHRLSEPETQCLVNTLKKYGRYIKLYVSIHAHGSMIMYPWGYTSKTVADEYELKNCAKLAADAVKSVFPSSCYAIGQISKVLYFSSGGSCDFVKGMHNIKFSYTIELHKSGPTGFEPSASEIVPMGEEVVLAVEAMIKYVYNYYRC